MASGLTVQNKVEAALLALGMSATYTPVTKVGDGTDGSVAETPGTPVSVKITPPEPYTKEEVSSDVIRMSDLETYLQYKEVNNPRVGDKLTIASTTYQIMAVMPVNFGDDIILFGLRLRE